MLGLNSTQRELKGHARALAESAVAKPPNPTSTVFA